jgi:iron complex transport system ATP-binding protein
MLEMQNVTVERGGREILQQASLQISPGEMKGIAGPNGCGKSTILRIMSGLWHPSQGRVLLGGRALDTLERRQIARSISYVPQDEHVTFGYTVEQIVRMGRYPHRGRFAPESQHDRSVVASAIERCDIGHLRRRAVRTLSGGELQRVLIARSLAVEATFILLDEPTASLDLEHAIDVFELCRQLAAGGKGVLLVTHDLNALARYSSEIALLDEGRIVGSGPCNEVMTPENLERTFGVSTELLCSRDGNIVYVFHQRETNG